jgi:hypothetical protein
VLLIFVSGKIVLTGARSRHEVYAAFNKIYPLLLRYDRTRFRAAGGSAAVAPVATATAVAAATADDSAPPPILHARPKPVEQSK